MSISLWLADHNAACLRTVQRWLDLGYAIPVAVLHAVWPDPTWQSILRDMVVATCGDRRYFDPPVVVGVLHGVDEDGVDVEGFDGALTRVVTADVVLPRAGDIPDLAAARRLAGADAAGQLGRTGRGRRIDRSELRADYDWVRHWDRFVGLAAVGPDHPREEAMRARRYTHPDLGERPVISFLPESAGPGADLLAASRGFAPPQVSEPLTATRRQVLGYPAWALASDPANADVAVAALAVLDGARRTAVDEPKAAFEELAVQAHRLPASHRPAFWREAAGCFYNTEGVWNDQSEGGKQAGVRSREACEATGLLADLDLWYALALDRNADLAECCEAIAAANGAAAAHDAYREGALAVGGGGSFVFKRLREFAKAAGRAGVDQDAADLAAYIRHNGEGFTISDTVLKARRKAFVRMAQTDDVALRLLFVGTYGLTVLERAGVLAALQRDRTVAAKLLGGVLWPGSTPAVWVAEHLGENLRSGREYGVCLALLDYFAPALVADGGAIDLRAADGRVALNALDIAVQHGIPLTHPVDEVALTAWFRSAPEIRRELEHAAAAYPEPLARAVARFDGAPEPYPPARNRPEPPAMQLAQLRAFPALVPFVTDGVPATAPR